MFTRGVRARHRRSIVQNLSLNEKLFIQLDKFGNFDWSCERADRHAQGNHLGTVCLSEHMHLVAGRLVPPAGVRCAGVCSAWLIESKIMNDSRDSCNGPASRTSLTITKSVN